MTVRYRVQDATKDPDREVDGIAKLTVLGRPDAPRAPRIEEVRSETVVLSWDQPNNNGADITGYTLRTNTGQEHACATTTCTFDGLKNNVKYTFTVTATNEVNESEPSPASREARPDEKPDKPEPPSLEFGDSELRRELEEPVLHRPVADQVREPGDQPGPDQRRDRRSPASTAAGPPGQGWRTAPPTRCGCRPRTTPRPVGLVRAVRAGDPGRAAGGAPIARNAEPGEDRRRRRDPVTWTAPPTTVTRSTSTGWGSTRTASSSSRSTPRERRRPSTDLSTEFHVHLQGPCDEQGRRRGREPVLQRGGAVRHPGHSRSTHCQAGLGNTSGQAERQLERYRRLPRHRAALRGAGQQRQHARTRATATSDHVSAA